MTETRIGFSFNNPDITNSYHAPSWGLLLSPDELRYDEMFGNALVAENDSQSITDDQLNDYIRLAIRYLEVELNIDILPRTIRYSDPIGEDGTAVVRTDFDDSALLATMTHKQQKELYIREQGYPFRTVAARKEMRVKLRRRPVRDLLTAKFVDPYFSNTIMDLMPYRIVKDGFTGVCYFRPRMMKMRMAYFDYIWQNYLMNPYGNDMQRIFLLDYTTGYENCQDVPDELRYIIKLTAAITLMNIYGDGRSAGISSSSLGLNAVSESITTTMSPTNSLFGAKIRQYQIDRKAWFAQNRSKYSRTTIGKL
jgi:hypothetical protein